MYIYIYMGEKGFIKGNEKIEERVVNERPMGLQIIEPIYDYNFIIKIFDIPEYLFRNYMFYNIGEDLMFKTEFMETVNYVFNPKIFFDIMDVEIDYLNPAGAIIQGHQFSAKGSY